MNERGNVERSVMKIDNCFDDTGFDEKILESSCVGDMVIWDGNNDHIECRVLLRRNDCDCNDLLRYFGWGDKFESYHIDGRRMGFVVDSHLSGIEDEIRGLVGLIAE